MTPAETRLYFGDQRVRIRQELLLGVGGIRCASTGVACTSTKGTAPSRLLNLHACA